MTQIELAALVERGIQLSWTTWVAMGNSRLSLGDVSYLKSIDGQGFERIFSVRLQEADPTLRITEMVQGMRSGTLPGSVLITSMTRPADLAQRLADQGFALDTTGRCMAMALEDLVRPGAPDGAIAVRLVECSEDRYTWLRIVCVGLFEADLMNRQQLDALCALLGTAFYLGTWQGEPVCAAMTIDDGDTSVLEFVATLPQYRRRGLGAAVVYRALQCLRDRDVGTISLRAEADGIGLYQRLGFRECGIRTVASYSGDGL